MAEYSQAAVDLLLSPTTARMLEEESRDFIRPTDYVEYLRSVYDGQDVHDNFMAEVAWYIEPVDSVLAMDPALPISRSFLKGALLGLRANELIFGRDFFNHLTHVRLPIPVAIEVIKQKKDPDATYQLFAATFLRIAEQGLDLANSFEPLLDRWEDELVPEIAHQRHLHNGLGFMLFAGQRAVQHIESEAMASQLNDDTPIEWELLLKEPNS